MPKAIIRSSRPLLEINNLIEDKANVVIKKDTPISRLTNIKVKIITIKINIPDKYYGDRRKLKTFFI